MTTKHRPDLFTHTLNHLRTGAAEELSDELAAALQASKETGKMATVTLVLKIKPETGMSGIFDIQEEIKSKLPQLPRGRTIMFETPEGNLVTDDPQQEKLPLRAVDTDPDQDAPLKQVAER